MLFHFDYFSFQMNKKINEHRIRKVNYQVGFDEFLNCVKENLDHVPDDQKRYFDEPFSIKKKYVGLLGRYALGR